LVEVVTLAENEGGAGGFHEGLKAAYAGGAEWAWAMDDDTIPRPDCLAYLLAAREQVPPTARAPLLLASTVVWSDGTLHPMNTPGYGRGQAAGPVAGDLVALRYASFVSLMVHRDAIRRHGLPLKHYFIWSDDIEYTARILRDDDVGYLAPDSVAVHKTLRPYTAVSTTGDRFYFHVRNHVFMLRGTSFDRREKLTLVHAVVATSWSYMRLNHWRPRHARTILRGLRDGFRRVPLCP
jgi:GT2 family glycosyltransferase